MSKKTNTTSTRTLQDPRIPVQTKLAAWTWPRTPFVAANVATVNASSQPAHP